MVKLIDGKAVAASVVDKVKHAAAEFSAATGKKPGLAVVLVGEDSASQVYVASKGRRAEECGFTSIQHSLPAETSQEDLLALVSKMNADASIHGILVQLPLPGHIDADAITQAVDPAKDVDGLHVVNAGKLMTGDLKSGLISCTPAGAMLFVRQTHGDDLSGLNAVVIGRSNLFGKPMAALLLNANATVTICHSRTADLPAACRNADILVAAVGRPEMVRSDWVKPGATLIDVGINRIPAPEKGEGKTRLVGDIAFAECSEIADTITPVPGGVGPMTISMLMANTMIAAARAEAQPIPQF